MTATLAAARATVEKIRASGLSIYDSLSDRPDLYLSRPQLEAVLNADLIGLNLCFPIRTRSKVLKTRVCEVLGYSVPRSFKKEQPRFPGQNVDTYVQKANNLQIWNEEVSAARRYVLIRVDENDRVTRVRVANGTEIAALDKTGTLTQKFQAASRKPVTGSVLNSASDTRQLIKFVESEQPSVRGIGEIFECLAALAGKRFKNPGLDQERNRGAILHELVQLALGELEYSDTGQFPDVPTQLLEVKLQTSPTIDLGLVSPDSEEALAINPSLRHCDVRYAVFYASTIGEELEIKHVVVSTGADFFSFFRKFEGLVTNAKLQIPLPKGFFD